MKNQALFEIKKTQTDFPRVKITSSKLAYDVIRKYYSDDIEIYESFFILLVDRSNTTVGYAKISQGGIVGTVVDIKLIAKYCLDSLCSGVILAHNHPSGNLAPSDADKQITSKIKSALGLIEVNVLDHLILTVDNFYSFNDEGNL
jgi:DNA repair protein RadC